MSIVVFSDRIKFIFHVSEPIKIDLINVNQRMVYLTDARMDLPNFSLVSVSPNKYFYLFCLPKPMQRIQFSIKDLPEI